MHLAETKEQARKDVEYGIVPFSNYFTHVLPAGPVRGDTAQEIIDNVDEDGFAVIGTPDDAIREDPGARRPVAAASGRSCCSATTGPTPPRRSAASSCSRSTSCRTSSDQLAPAAASCDWVTGSGGEFVDRAANAIMQAIADHAASKQTS